LSRGRTPINADNSRLINQRLSALISGLTYFTSQFLTSRFEAARLKHAAIWICD